PDTAVCHGGDVSIMFDGFATAYYWEIISGVNIGSGMSATLQATNGQAEFTFTANNTTSATTYAYYKVTPKYVDGTDVCAGDPIYFKIEVNLSLDAPDVDDQVFCAGVPTQPIVLSGPLPSTSYRWEVQGTEPIEGLAAMSGWETIPSFTPINNTPLPKTYTIKVESFGNCNDETTFDITIVPKATVAYIGDQEVCEGEDVTVTISGNAAYFTWTIVGGSDIGSGMSATLPVTGGQATFTFTANVVGYAIYEVTPVYADGTTICEGSSVTFRVDVNPTQEVLEVQDYVFCAGRATQPITFVGSVPGTIYRWEVLHGQVIEGLRTWDYGAIPSFIPVNNTMEPLVYEIEVGAMGSCSGTTTFTITITPEPLMNLIADKYQCYEEFALEFTGTAQYYDWSIIAGEELDPLQGMNGRVYAYPDGTATLRIDPTDHPVHKDIRSATFRVVPVYGIFEGEPVIFTVVVYPPVVMNPVESQVWCNGSDVPETVFTGSLDGLVYTWEFVGDVIPGFNKTGTGAFPAFHAVNTTDDTKNYTISVKPEFYLPDGTVCQTYPSPDEEWFDIAIMPQPKVTNVARRYEYCTGDIVPKLTFEGVAKYYEWEQTSGANIGLSEESGTREMPAFQAINNGDADLVAVFNVTPFFTYLDEVCKGETETFEIVVKPNVTLLPVTSREYCSGDVVSQIALLTSKPGAVVRWEATGDAIGLPVTSGYGDIPPFTAKNIGSTIAEATIALTIENECGNNAESFTITVYPEVRIDPASIADISICPTEGAAIIVNPTTNIPSPITYRWNNDRSDIGWPWETIANTMYFEPIANTTGHPIVATITVTPLYIKHIGQADYCEGESRTFTITLHPSVSILGGGHAGNICGGGDFHYEVMASDPAATLTWVRNGVAGINGGQGASGFGNVINERLENATTQPITVTYTFTAGYQDCQTSAEVTVTVLPAPVIVTPEMTTACFDDADIKIECVNGAGWSYRVELDDRAVQAGYKAAANFTQVPADEKIVIKSDYPELTPGLYTGTIYFKTENGCETSNGFRFRVYTPLVIVSVSESLTGLCGDIDIELTVSVDADPENVLTYEWEYNGNIVQRSANPAYRATQIGTYRVHVIGTECGDRWSEPITLERNTELSIEEKWVNVLAIPDPERQHVGYQWYRDGVAINKDGNTQYYSVEDAPVGVEYEYTVRIEYADGDFVTTCPYLYARQETPRAIKVYPNPVASNDKLNVYLDMPTAELDGAQVFVYDITGRMFANQIADQSLTTIGMHVIPGVYVVRVVTVSGEVYTEKVVVR
ncbi:T9SS type A sorting domain-containing protein, partial [Bacteroidales bacterium OttesenSCG-928-J16]|nr:T9SS type A sorting domain-containing protein [Bacteroidales bacterium OttesenSCG-928-J16]